MGKLKSSRKEWGVACTRAELHLSFHGIFQTGCRCLQATRRFKRVAGCSSRRTVSLFILGSQKLHDSIIRFLMDCVSCATTSIQESTIDLFLTTRVATYPEIDPSVNPLVRNVATKLAPVTKCLCQKLRSLPYCCLHLPGACDWCFPILCPPHQRAY